MRLSLYRGGIRSIAWWLSATAVVAVLVADVWGHAEQGAVDAATYVYAATFGVFAAIGLYVWATRPRQGLIGPLWTLSPLLQVVEDLLPAWPESRLAATLGLTFLGIGAVIATHWVLAYPSGLLPSRQMRIGVALI